jgi:hypothetical protein
MTEAQSNPTSPPQRPHCYICSATETLTKDHVPPKGFFPPQDRDGLLTAPLCLPCHSPLTKTDEAMRVWITAAAARHSGAAAWIWDNKVMGSTFKRSPKLRQNIVEKHLHEMTVETPEGPVTKPVITMPQGRVIPFVRRLTKGFLYALHPDYNYMSDRFNVVYRLPTENVVKTLAKLSSYLSTRSFGRESFRVWHGITEDDKKSGVWIFLFYDTVCFVCFHGTIGAFTQQDLEDGYVEDPSLPPKL